MKKIFIILLICLFKFENCLLQTNFVFFKTKVYNVDDSVEMDKLMKRVSKIINNDYYYGIHFEIGENNQSYSGTIEKIKNQFDLIPDKIRSRSYVSTKPYFRKGDNLFFKKRRVIFLKITKLKGRASIYPKNLEKYFQ